MWRRHSSSVSVCGSVALPCRRFALLFSWELHLPVAVYVERTRSAAPPHARTSAAGSTERRRCLLFPTPSLYMTGQHCVCGSKEGLWLFHQVQPVPFAFTIWASHLLSPSGRAQRVIVLPRRCDSPRLRPFLSLQTNPSFSTPDGQSIGPE